MQRGEVSDPVTSRERSRAGTGHLHQGLWAPCSTLACTQLPHSRPHRTQQTPPATNRRELSGSPTQGPQAERGTRLPQWGQGWVGTGGSTQRKCFALLPPEAEWSLAIWSPQAPCLLLRPLRFCAETHAGGSLCRWGHLAGPPARKGTAARREASPATGSPSPACPMQPGTTAFRTSVIRKHYKSVT